MKNNEYWQSLENELIILKNQRDELSRKIHLMSVELRQHKGTLINRKIDTSSLCYQMYGKRQKDLTPEQLKEYNRIMQRNRRAKKKENKED